TRTALTISASLAQIGEFSFILAGLGATLGVLPPEGRDLILAGAIFSILANPFIFAAVVGKTDDDRRAVANEERQAADAKAAAAGHTVLIGYGQVGALVAQGAPHGLTVVEEQADLAD